MEQIKYNKTKQNKRKQAKIGYVYDKTKDKSIENAMIIIRVAFTLITI